MWCVWYVPPLPWPSLPSFDLLSYVEMGHCLSKYIQCLIFYSSGQMMVTLACVTIVKDKRIKQDLSILWDYSNITTELRRISFLAPSAPVNMMFQTVAMHLFTPGPVYVRTLPGIIHYRTLLITLTFNLTLKPSRSFPLILSGAKWWIILNYF